MLEPTLRQYLFIYYRLQAGASLSPAQRQVLAKAAAAHCQSFRLLRAADGQTWMEILEGIRADDEAAAAMDACWQHEDFAALLAGARHCEHFTDPPPT